MLLAGLAAGLYWYNSLDNKNLNNTRWLSRSFKGVKSIHVQVDEGTYMITEMEGEWEAQLPGASWNLSARALSSKVNAYLVKLADLTPYRSIGGVDLGGPEKYGLDTPEFKIIVTFAEKDSKPLTLKLTRDESGSVFGWNSDSPSLVYEFNDKTLEKFALPATHFLDKKVFHFEEGTVTRLQLVQPFGSSWLVDKRNEGFFFSLPGYLKEKPASDSELKLYIHALALLRATSLVLEPVVTDKRMPSLTIRLWNGPDDEPSQVEFFTVKDDPGVYLGKSSWLTVPFLLDAESVGQLIRSAFDVQGRTVVKLDLGTVARFIVVHGGKQYSAERGDTGWRVNGGKKDIPGIDMSLWRFTELKFEALPLNNLPDSAVELMYCKFLDKDGEKLTEMTFYADVKLPQGQCWMKNGGGMYYPVSSRLFKDLQGVFPANPNGIN